MTKKIQFRAFIPPIMSAFRIGGDSVRIQLDVPKSDLGDMIGLTALTDTSLIVTIEVDRNKRATKTVEKEKTPFGQYWKEWLKPNGHGGAAIFSPTLLTALELDGEPATQESIHDALKAALGVFSLSREVGPERFETWLLERHLDGLVTMSRQIRARVEEQDAKAS